MSKTPANQSHLRLVGHYLRQNPNTIHCAGEWRRYREGIWERHEDGAVRKEVLGTLKTYANGTPINRNLLSSVYHLTQTETFHADDTFDSDDDLIAFSDCVLRVSTGEVREHSPDDFVTTKLPYAYNPNAQSDTWPLVLSSTNPEYLPFLQEYAGYCLTPSTKHELALWCWGDPGSGKSTFITGLEAMLGTRCCTLGLADIERSNFALAQIPGKTLAISTEQPSRFVRCAHVLNALISGESIPFERKFIDPVTLRPRVKLVWAMNELPRIDSSGVGLFRRVVPVPWKQVEKPDPQVKEIAASIGAVVFNWAFEGLKRLNERGRFDIPVGLIEERETYRTQNDIPQVFITDCCERVDAIGENGQYNKVGGQSLYDSYKKWCGNTGHKHLSSTAFAGELKRLGIERVRMDGHTFWLGILIKTEPEFDVSM